MSVFILYGRYPYFTGTTLFASLLGLFLPRALGLGHGITIEMIESNVEATCCNVLGDLVCSVATKETVKLNTPAASKNK